MQAAAVDLRLEFEKQPVIPRASKGDELAGCWRQFPIDRTGRIQENKRPVQAAFLVSVVGMQGLPILVATRAA